MSALDYQRMIIGYHGCDATTVNEVLVDGQPLTPSENDYDWLGPGIYFWEHGPQRAYRWACEKAKRDDSINTPAVLGAYIHLGRCFDLLDIRNTELLRRMYPAFLRFSAGKPLPQNESPPGGAGEDLVLRKLDCAVVKWSLDRLREQEDDRQTVRCVFTEGEPAFPESRIMLKSHIQVAVRDPACILGFFKPRGDFASESG